MHIGAIRLSLAASAAVALMAGAAALPASAQSTTYPAGTDCSKLVGNSKTECEHQAKNASAPDNSNNPSNAEINTSSPTPPETTSSGTLQPTTGTNAPASTTQPANGQDCTAMVGTTKTECEQNGKKVGVPDNSNNPDQSN